MKFPSVTIHVTVKNSVKTIKACIDSLLRLDYPNKKIIVTDAFSTDGTYEVLKKYGDKIQLVRVRGTAPTAHNYILKKVNTEFYAMTDSDCIVDKNWLKNLLSSFTSKEIIAAGGIVKTPKNVNRLQSLIGRELENRYNHFPKFVSRFPTMNMVVRTSVAKKIKMNENLGVAFETDWGFKLEKFGKLIYVPSAIVWHYHRATLFSYFKQQMNYTRFFFQAYSKHKGKIKGDYISTRLMFLQEFLFGVATPVFLLSIFSIIFLLPFFFISFMLLISYLIVAFPLSKKLGDITMYIFLFFVRNIAWSFGLVLSLIEKIF